MFRYNQQSTKAHCTLHGIPIATTQLVLIFPMCMVQCNGTGLRVQGTSLRVKGIGLKVQGTELRAQGTGLRVQG